MSEQDAVADLVAVLRERFASSYSAVYRRPDGTISADWVAYDTLGAALLGPQHNQYVGSRLGYIERPFCGPPRLFGPSSSTMIDLRR